MTNQAILDDTEIKVNGIQALNKALGHTGALRFMTLVQREPTEYVQIARQTIDQLLPVRLSPEARTGLSFALLSRFPSMPTIGILPSVLVNRPD